MVETTNQKGSSPVWLLHSHSLMFYMTCHWQFFNNFGRHLEPPAQFASHVSWSVWHGVDPNCTKALIVKLELWLAFLHTHRYIYICMYIDPKKDGTVELYMCVCDIYIYIGIFYLLVRYTFILNYILICVYIYIYLERDTVVIDDLSLYLVITFSLDQISERSQHPQSELPEAYLASSHLAIPTLPLESQVPKLVLVGKNTGPSYLWPINGWLVGGFKHFLFSIMHGIILPID